MTGGGLGIVNEITATRKTFLLGGGRGEEGGVPTIKRRRAIKKAARGKDSSTVKGNIEKRDFRVTRTTGMSETKFWYWKKGKDTFRAKKDNSKDRVSRISKLLWLENRKKIFKIE